MPLTYKVNAGSGDFKSVPSGSHIAICNMVADCGLQPGTAAYPDPKRQVYIRFEIPEERINYERDGRHVDGPAIIGSFFTASMHEKATLRKRLEGWRGKTFTNDEASNFDVSSILGKPCMLAVVENKVGDKVYTNIASISPVPKGTPIPKQENPSVLFSEEDTGMWDRVPEWLQKKINGRIIPKTEAKSYTNDFGGEGITDDDIPF